jgi:hypothetical protein
MYELWSVDDTTNHKTTKTFDGLFFMPLIFFQRKQYTQVKYCMQYHWKNYFTITRFLLDHKQAAFNLFKNYLKFVNYSL